jgi:translation elongation factor EF-Tu-like GTPase
LESEAEDLDEYDADNDLIPVSTTVSVLNNEQLEILKANFKNLINEMNNTNDDERKEIIKAQLTTVVEEITTIVTKPMFNK